MPLDPACGRWSVGTSYCQAARYPCIWLTLQSSEENRSSASADRMALENETKPVPEFVVDSLLRSPVVTIRDTYCRGTCRHPSAEECAITTQLVFSYRGVCVRHVGLDQAVAEANKVQCF
jgi:hypothetical protein